MSEHSNNAQAIIDSTTSLAKVERIEGGGLAPAAFVPTGKELVELNNLRNQEEDWKLRRVRGTAKLTKPESFVQHVKRFLNAAVALFATNSAITAIFDYHRAVRQAVDDEHDLDEVDIYADHAEHRAVYAWPFSEAWKTWSKAWSGGHLSSVDLATLLEDRIVDVLAPTSPELFRSTHDIVQTLGLTLGSASDLMAVARDFRVSVKRDIAAAHNLDTGEVQIEYSEVHEGARAAKKSVNVPTGFLLALPVFEDGAAFQVVVRLRYLLDGPKVLWQLKAHAIDEVVRVATEAQVKAITDELPDVPLFWGTPEA